MSDQRKMLRARPTIYSGVSMRSRLEAAWAEQFDSMAWEWTYEPQCFATADGQYLPDFQVHVPGLSEHVFVEVKPAPWMSQEDNGFDDTFPCAGPEWNQSWNEACKRIDKKVGRLHKIIAGNVRCDLFLICTSANEEGAVEIYAAVEDPDNRSNQTMVHPASCGRCSGLLTRHPSHSPLVECAIHHRPWQRHQPVSSLYAPNGFTCYKPFGGLPDDPFMERLRGRTTQ